MCLPRQQRAHGFQTVYSFAMVSGIRDITVRPHEDSIVTICKSQLRDVAHSFGEPMHGILDPHVVMGTADEEKAAADTLASAY